MRARTDLAMRSLVGTCVIAAAAAGCNDGRSVELDGTEAALSLCGSPDSLGFIASQGFGAATTKAAGATPAGWPVLNEIGSVYVAISRSCEFWAYTASGPDGSPGGVLHTGRLSDEQRSNLEGRLDLERWDALEPVHGLCCAVDFPTSSYYWGDRSFTWIGASSANGPPPLPDGFPVDPSVLHSEIADHLAELGTPSEGSVRYTVLEVMESLDRDYAQAPTWPLEFAIGEVSVRLEEYWEAGQPAYTAEGPDAEALRALRTSAREKAFGNVIGGFVPIEEPNGSRYQVYIRDVGPFELPVGVPARDPRNL